MNWLRILAYYALAALLGAYLYAYRAQRQPQELSSEDSERPLIAAVVEDIDHVRIDKGEIELEFSRNDSGRWELRSHPGLRFNSDLLDAVLDTLTSIAPIEIVDTSSDSAGQYGLRPPKVRMRVERDGVILSTLAFGVRNPTRTAVYARKSGSDSVYLLGLNSSYYLDLIFEQFAKELRSRGISRGDGEDGAWTSDSPRNKNSF